MLFREFDINKQNHILFYKSVLAVNLQPGYSLPVMDKNERFVEWRQSPNGEKGSVIWARVQSSTWNF